MNSLIPRFAIPYGPRALAGASAASLTGAIASGRAVENLLGRREYLWTGSGRQALVLMLRALQLGEGAKVAVPLFSSSAVTSALKAADCEPLYVDVDPQTLMMDAGALARTMDRTGSRVRAVVPVHLFGNVVDMDRVMSAAAGVPVIEDTAQSIGSLWRHRLTGTFGLGSIYSFASSKAIAAGGGGIAAWNASSDAEFGARLRKLAESLEPRSRLDSLRCAVMQFAKSALFSRELYALVGNRLRSGTEDRGYLLAKIDSLGITPASAAAVRILAARFPERLRRQRANSLSLIAMLRDIEGIVLPIEPAGATYSYSLFAVLAADAGERDAVRRIMRSLGVDTSNVHHNCVETAGRNGYAGSCPISESAAGRILTLPNYAGLSTRDLDRIASAFRTAVKQHRTLARPARLEAYAV
jgi:dTDP-4-amino-4,6-dideoxygalactose transaminase